MSGSLGEINFCFLDMKMLFLDVLSVINESAVKFYPLDRFIISLWQGYPSIRENQTDFPHEALFHDFGYPKKKHCYIIAQFSRNEGTSSPWIRNAD